jgi:mannose-6-phosphate isomerase-like protein (cupin superfamily)
VKGFIGDIEELTRENRDFRRVLHTGPNLQLVVMSLRAGEEIGEEVHTDHDQFFRVEKGKGEVWIEGERSKIRMGTVMLIPAGARHNVRNTGEKRLRLYTLYAPPQHADGTVHASKAEADAADEHFAGHPAE